MHLAVRVNGVLRSERNGKPQKCKFDDYEWGDKLIERERCNEIIQQYYTEIYNYCFARMNYDKYAAEDCTQEIFVALFRKIKDLDDDNIRIWLYRTADNIMNAYRRKNISGDLSIEDSPEVSDISENPFDNENEEENIFDVLDDEEKNIVKEYYCSDYGDKKSVAKKLGLTINSLYQKIHKIKNKLRNGKN